MIFSSNMGLCKEHYKNVWEYFDNLGDQFKNEPVEITQSKNGQTNISITMGEKTFHLHSQYNPTNEAEKWLETYIESAQKAKHIFFYGFGMGYHVDLLMSKLKPTPFTIYEPIPEVFFQFMQTKLLSDLPVKYLKNIFLGDSVDFFTRHFLDSYTSDVLIIVNPTYERIFPEITKNFTEIFKKNIKHKLMSLQTHLSYERVWTYNAECNFSKILKTQNMIREKKKYFEDKPVIIVAAGPSLEDEYENLRKIKQQGLAYIFAVGSANKALLSANIYPDAVVSYDPNLVNHEVFTEIIEGKISNIPLIYGSTIGFQTLELYPGPMLHMFMSQDHISLYYLSDFDNEEVIADSASVAVVAVQLARKLGANLVVLVGQNFSFRNQQYYANGVSYNLRPTHLTEEEKSILVKVEAVDGGEVLTQEVHNVARRQMEQVIAEMPNIPVINSTKGGAKIQGAVYEHLSDVIQNKLKTSIVNKDWFQGERTIHDKRYMDTQKSEMMTQHENLDKLVIHIVKNIKKLEAAAATFNVKKTSEIIDQIAKQNGELYTNLYYKVYLEPMVKVQYDIFQKSLVEINQIKNVIQKARAIIKTFGAFILDCQHVMRDNEQFFQLMMKHIEIAKDQELEGSESK